MRFATSSTARLGIVYGRRRPGKTHLVEHLARACGGLYFGTSGQPLRGRANLELVLAHRERLSTPDIKLLLICDAGFDRELERVGRVRSDVELIDADRLRHGD